MRDADGFGMWVVSTIYIYAAADDDCCFHIHVNLYDFMLYPIYEC